MFYKEFQSTKSLLDYLVHIMPDLNMIEIRRHVRPSINNSAAKKLFALWRDEKNALGKNLLRRPTSFPVEDIRLMEREGLVKKQGDNVEITAQGAEIIKTMILGDDRSALDDDGGIVDYHTAFANTLPKRKMTKKAKSASAHGQSADNWYQAVKHGSSNNPNDLS